MDGPDLIVSGGGEPSSPRRRRAVGLIAVVVVLAVVSAGVDQLARTRESGALLAQTARATSTAAYAERRVRAVADYSAPALFGADTSADVRASLLGVLQREAADLAPSIRTAATGVRGVRVLPWHGELRRARADATAYVTARADLLASAGQDLGVLFAPAPAAERARDRAQASLLVVVRGADADQRVGAALSGSAP